MTESALANRFTVFTEGDELYDDMLKRIADAKSGISLESYIFNPDAVGLQFINALIERARAGVPVRLHLDAFGSMSLALSAESTRLTEAGVELKWFNPLRWYVPLRYNRRNHRKLLIIDQQSVWLGGFNIHKENSRRESGDECWHDTQVRVDGPLAAEAQVYFDRLWQGHSDWAPAYNQKSDTILVSNQNWLQRHQLRRMLTLQFHKARSSIWICTPYFMPDHFLQRQMIKAARRGLDVRLLLPYQTDRPITQVIARAAYASLMKSGIRIFEYKPCFIHAKTILVDEDWCTTGSANLDYRSFFINYEINLVSSNRELGALLRKNMEVDIKNSRQINPDKWNANGWRSWFYRQAGLLFRNVL